MNEKIPPIYPAAPFLTDQERIEYLTRNFRPHLSSYLRSLPVAFRLAPTIAILNALIVSGGLAMSRQQEMNPWISIELAAPNEAAQNVHHQMSRYDILELAQTQYPMINDRIFVPPLTIRSAYVKIENDPEDIELRIEADVFGPKTLDLEAPSDQSVPPFFDLQTHQQNENLVITDADFNSGIVTLPLTENQGQQIIQILQHSPHPATDKPLTSPTDSFTHCSVFAGTGIKTVYSNQSKTTIPYVVYLLNLISPNNEREIGILAESTDFSKQASLYTVEHDPLVTMIYYETALDLVNICLNQ